MLVSRTTSCITLLILSALSATAPVHARPPSAEEASAPAAGADPGVERRLEALREEVARLRQDAAGAARLAELERQIEALSREIERLRSGSGGDTEVEASSGAWGLGAAASKVYAVKRGVSIGGYGEMLFQAPDDRREDGSESGRVSRLDFVRAVLYAGYKFDEHLLFNSEIEFEHASTGKGGEVAVEFAYLDYLLRPELNVRAGLLLLPMGFLNELHEPPGWLGARRPLTERQILPSTWRENGAGVFGEHGKLAWRLYLVNGLDALGFTAEGIRGGKQDGAQALSENFALTGRLDFQPNLATLLGGSFYRGNSGQGRGFDAPTTIVDLHAQYRSHGFDLRALYARASIGDVAELNAARELEGEDGVGSRLEGGYLQLGYNVLARRGSGQHSLTPYLRWERVNSQARVAEGFAADPASQKRIVTVGAAWKPHSQISVKADFESGSDEARTGVDQFNIQLGYIF